MREASFNRIDADMKNQSPFYETSMVKKEAKQLHNNL